MHAHLQNPVQRRQQVPLLLCRKDRGGVLSPKSAWPTLVYGRPTLSTRMINQQKTAHRAVRFLPEEEKRRRGMEPGGIRLSVGLEDWHDLIEDLQAAQDKV